MLENLHPYMWPLWTVMPPNVFYNGLMSINIYWLDRLAKLMLRYVKFNPELFKSFSRHVFYHLHLFYQIVTAIYFSQLYPNPHVTKHFVKPENMC